MSVAITFHGDSRNMQACAKCFLHSPRCREGGFSSGPSQGSLVAPMERWSPAADGEAFGDVLRRAEESMDLEAETLCPGLASSPPTEDWPKEKREDQVDETASLRSRGCSSSTRWSDSSSWWEQRSCDWQARGWSEVSWPDQENPLVAMPARDTIFDSILQTQERLESLPVGGGDAAKGLAAPSAAASQAGTEQEDADDLQWAMQIKDVCNNGVFQTGTALWKKFHRDVARDPEFLACRTRIEKEQFRMAWAQRTYDLIVNKRSHSKSTWSDKTNEGVYLNFESLASAEGGGHITPTSVQSAKRIAESCIQAGGDMVHVHPQSGQREYLYIKKKVRDGQRDCWSLTKEEQSLPKRPRERLHGDHGGAGPTSQQLQAALAMPHNDMEKEVGVSDASNAGRKQQPAAKRARKKDVEEHEEGGSQKKKRRCP